jgi:hypothetical protein
MNNQEIFDTVLNGIRIQKRPSVADFGCVLRGPCGTKCAIGWLIPDEAYDSDMEGIGPYAAARRAGVDITPDFANALQSAHDNSCVYSKDFMDAFETRMKEVARDWNLEYRGTEGV